MKDVFPAVVYEALVLVMLHHDRQHTTPPPHPPVPPPTCHSGFVSGWGGVGAGRGRAAQGVTRLRVKLSSAYGIYPLFGSNAQNKFDVQR